MSSSEVALGEIRERAEAQSLAYAQMIVYDEGVGGLGARHPEMFEDMLAWDQSTENGHADTVLFLLDQLDASEVALKEALEAVKRVRRYEAEAIYLLAQCDVALAAAEDRAAEAGATALEEAANEAARIEGGNPWIESGGEIVHCDDVRDDPAKWLRARAAKIASGA